MNLDDLFAKKHVLSTPDIAKAFDMSEHDVRSWATELGVTLIGQAFAWTRPDAEALLAAKDAARGRTMPINPPLETIGRVGFSVREAARALGMKDDALRRHIERHHTDEGDELVARLNGGIVARKRKGMARWMVVIPNAIRE